MHPQEVDRFLAKISSQESLFLSENEFRVIEQMVKEGLIKPVKEGYSLTDYGKVIKIMGYETHQKQKSKEQISSISVFPKSFIIFLTWLIAVISILSCVFYLST